MQRDHWGKRQLARDKQQDGDIRSAFQRDKARIMHAASFRRLQAKTQVVGVGISDFYRTRLTHSLEAAQIGTGILTQLRAKQPQLSEQLALDEQLIEAICLAHDIGHPPFGHGGEVALHYMMQAHGGFEGNGQTFRILTKLESYSPEHGMNLARRTLLGVIKYPGFIPTLDQDRKYPHKPDKFEKLKAEQWIPPKGLFEDERHAYDWVLSCISAEDKANFERCESKPNGVLSTLYKSVDCSIMELADDIAYAVHDLEDAIVMQLIDRFVFHQEITLVLQDMQIKGLSKMAQTLEDKLFAGDSYSRKNAIGYLINVFITEISLQAQEKFSESLLEYKAVLPQAFAAALTLFKHFVFTHVIRKPEIQILEYKGQQMIMALFEVFANEPLRLLPQNTAKRWEVAEDESARMRIIADYISGMTDQYANRTYANLFLPKSHRITDR